MSREAHVPFCEGLQGRFLRSTLPSMKEDQCQIYRGNAAEVLSGARKIALNMLRAETTRKISIPRKQKRAHGSTDYLEQVLTAGLKTLGDI